MNIDINKRLHQRAPYLMLDEVVEHHSTYIHAKKTPHLTDYYILGHFPGAPVVPGAVMQEMTTQAAGLLITEHHSPVSDYDSEKTLGFALGVLRAVHHAKYKNFARPGDVLNIKVELIQMIDNAFRFKAKIDVKGETIMFNEFTLINISDEKLRN